MRGKMVVYIMAYFRFNFRPVCYYMEQPGTWSVLFSSPFFAEGDLMEGFNFYSKPSHRLWFILSLQTRIPK